MAVQDHASCAFIYILISSNLRWVIGSLQQAISRSLVKMENNNIQYEGGDVLIRTTWDSTDFFLVHRHVLSKRSTYFRALLGDHWNKPRALNLNGEGAQIWSLYLKPDMKDLAHVTFVLSSDVSSPRMEPRCGNLYQRSLMFADLHTTRDRRSGRDFRQSVPH